MRHYFARERLPHSFARPISRQRSSLRFSHACDVAGSRSERATGDHPVGPSDPRSSRLFRTLTIAASSPAAET